MGKGYYKGISSGINSCTDSILNLLRGKFTIWRKRLVCFPILKKAIIPFATISTSNLMFMFSTVKASTLTDIILEKRGILTTDFIGNENGSILDIPKTVIHNIDVITSGFIKVMDWFNNLPVSMPKLTADLLTHIYHFLAGIVLQTPLFIFNNPYLKNTSLTFSVISISIVTIFTIIEAFMQMFNKRHTDFSKIVKRWAIVASVSGFMPFLFETSFNLLNKLSSAITHIGMNGGENGLIYSEKIGWFDTLIIVLFNLTAISMLIPICLQAARRWFDLLTLCAISPLALSAYCFDRHRHYFDKWWDSVQTHGITQIVYAVYILLIGVLIFSTQAIQGGFITLAIKILLVLAGLNKLANPPSFISRMTDNGGDIISEYDKTKRTFKNMYDNITLRKLRPVQFVKDKITEKKTLKETVKSLQQKHNRRYVKDLLQGGKAK